jgi:transcriptional regulator with XRE-family HTH domain
MTDVRAIRRQLGLSQGQLADKLGLNQSTISRFETGELPVDERTTLALDAIVMREGAGAHVSAEVAA